MEVWTVQPAEVLAAVEHSGCLYVESSRLPASYVPPAYRWLRQRLRHRIPGYGAHYPWWVYCAKPSLRKCRFSRPLDAEEVLITLDVSPTELASFPVRAWNLVYCGKYLPLDGKARRSGDRKTRQDVQSSWENLFNPRLTGYGLAREGVLEALRANQIVASATLWDRRLALAERRGRRGPLAARWVETEAQRGEARAPS